MISTSLHDLGACLTWAYGNEGAAGLLEAPLQSPRDTIPIRPSLPGGTEIPSEPAVKAVRTAKSCLRPLKKDLPVKAYWGSLPATRQPPAQN